MTRQMTRSVAHHDHVEPDPGVLGTPQQHAVSLLVNCQPDSEVAPLGCQVHVLNVGEFDLPGSTITSQSHGWEYQGETYFP